MEEDEPDYSTPIGKVIKHINTLCKKPQIDEQLSDALDLFNKKLEEQEKYLVNGIFSINFSEAALFLQSSAELYGKKVDLLWDQLLEYHTRLIQYDCDHQREKGGSIDKEVIEKLEERRNRYKRRKKFKLVLQSSEVQKVSDTLFDAAKDAKSSTSSGYDSDDDYTKSWKDLEWKSSEMRSIPNIVYKQMTQMYRLKNYHILKCQDFEIWDPEDGEFNTKYSRIPGWHHTLHLFEYNDKGLLPDKNNIIARLRLTAYGRIRFMISRKIPLNTPFEQYKDEYMAYRKKFFEDEAKKWQNMPLDTLEDLRKQLQYLVQKEREENGESSTGGSTKFGRYGIKEMTPDTAMDKIDLLDNSDDDSLFELSVTCDNEFTRSDLFVRLEKLSTDLINTKLRQDSGFFDFSSDSEECDNTSATNTEGCEETSTVVNETTGDINTEVENNNSDGNGIESEVLPADTNKDTNTEIGINVDMEKDVYTNKDGERVQNENGENNLVCNIDTMNEHTNVPETNVENDRGENVEALNERTNDAEDLDNFDTRSYVSDHDYCLTIAPSIESDNKTGDISADAVNVSTKKNNECKDNGVKKVTKDVPGEPFFAIPRIIPRTIKVAESRVKEKLKSNNLDNDQLLPKRRKLSAKQMEKLLQSKIKPVKEQKFEKFFSMNYQPQLGEGEVSLVECESDESDTENLDEIPEDNLHNESVHSKHDDTQSIMSDHDYCQAIDDVLNESGFVDTSSNHPTPEPELVQSNLQENCPNSAPEALPTNYDDQCISLDDEYEKLLAALKESRKNQDKTDNITPVRPPTEQDIKEKERKELQARVEEWRNSITPVLRNLKENDFDIHEYGFRIMDSLEVDKPKPFGNIVDGKSSAEVVRYFISSLQLANTNNIEICGAQQGRLSNDTFNVKLLTKDRYHEHLNEYLAPSEETLMEKMERVRAMQSAKQSNSGESSPKKQKLMVSSKGKKNRSPNTGKRTNSSSSIVPLPSAELSQEKNTEQSKSHDKTNTEATLHAKEVQDENNCSLNTYQARSLLKGKRILKRPVMSEKMSNTHNFDISTPSTSRSFCTPYRPADEPSTSSSPDISYSQFEHNFSSNVSSSLALSPNKRRKDSKEDTFSERLMALQGLNADIQLHSTPTGAPSPKQLKISLMRQKSLLFE